MGLAANRKRRDEKRDGELAGKLDGANMCSTCWSLDDAAI